MDPFVSLSAETRSQVLILLRSEDDIGRLCRASPVMLKHYLDYKIYISRAQLTVHLDDDLLQDAMAIARFPTTQAIDYNEYEAAVSLHLAKWSRRQLPNPLASGDDSSLVKLGNLFRRLEKYMSDYMAKATSPSVPRAYLCLDNVSQGQSQSRYTHAPFDLGRLNKDEKKRLFQAFLRYELFCRVDHPRTRSEDVHNRTRFFAVKECRRLQQWELEGIRCVHEYVRCLYGAVLAHCSGVIRPQPAVQISSRPSYWHFDADPYSSDLGFPGIYSHTTPKMADYGFRIISFLINTATQGEKGRRKATKWFESFTKDSPTLKRSLPVPGGLALAFDYPRSRAGDFRRGPGMCQKLFAVMRSQERLGSLIEPSEASLRRSVFRQRAWVLLDNARLYPRARLSHFPSKRDITCHTRKGKALCAQLSRAQL
ncbi:hypothetical protein ACHAPT_012969 [Fusarium lateritium]